MADPGADRFDPPDEPSNAELRREARERALGLLYEADAKGRSPGEVVDALPVPLDGYARRLVLGVEEERDDLDARISRLAVNWTLDRLAAVDAILLRIAGYELGRCPDVPTGVVLNEAVELAKAYSTDGSGRFVNGVLASLAAELRPG